MVSPSVTYFVCIHVFQVHSTNRKTVLEKYGNMEKYVTWKCGHVMYCYDCGEV